MGPDLLGHLLLPVLFLVGVIALLTMLVVVEQQTMPTMTATPALPDGAGTADTEALRAS